MKAYRLETAESTVLYMYYLINIIKVCNIQDQIV